MSMWPGFDRERATRLLNALYLQVGPDRQPHASGGGERVWFGGSLGSAGSGADGCEHASARKLEPLQAIR